MKKYLLSAIAIICVLLTVAACANNASQPTGISQETRDKVFATVTENLPNLQDIYHVLSQTSPMAGVLSINLFIDTKGKVANAKVEAIEGNLSGDMKKAVKDEVMQWTFTTDVMMNYQFKATFQKM